MEKLPVDIEGHPVRIGDKVRILSLSGDWYENLPEDEAPYVHSMIGEVLEVEEIDEYGSFWVRKSWPNEADGTCIGHSIALAPDEMELVDA